MFPSLYPIALLFSRLRSFDGKVKLQTEIAETQKKIELTDISEFYDLFL